MGIDPVYRVLREAFSPELRPSVTSNVAIFEPIFFPAVQNLLDYDALRLQPFYAGATVRFNGGWHRVADPVGHAVPGCTTALRMETVRGVHICR